jgi:hypothetical protein
MTKSWNERQFEVLANTYASDAVPMMKWSGGREEADQYAQRLVAFQEELKAKEEKGA